MDKLKECAIAFSNLLNTEYNIIIGRKNQIKNIHIRFDKTHFYHLCGLHKLIDYSDIKTKSRSTIFDSILSEKLTYKSISKSNYFHNIEKRLISLSNIEILLDNNQLIFLYNSSTNKFSLIQADYLLCNNFEGNDIYIFLSKIDNSENYFCRSFFPKDKKDYTIGQPSYTLLYKEKIDLITGKKEIQLDRLYGYKVISDEEVQLLRKADIKLDIISQNNKEVSIRYFLRNEKEINSILQQFNLKDTDVQKTSPLSCTIIKKNAETISKKHNKNKSFDKHKNPYEIE